jgi:hypothetical protein
LDSQVPSGCRRYSVELRKPLGMVLEEDRHGAIFVVRCCRRSLL